MGNVGLLFSISVKHPFFSDGRCRGLDFIPTTTCRTNIEKIGLILRDTADGICLFYDEDRLDALKLYVEDSDDPLSFCFKVFSNNQSFQNVTDPALYKKDSLLYFGNNNFKKKSTSPIILSKKKYVSEDDFQKPDSPIIEGILSSTDLLIRPSFIINISNFGKSKTFLKKNLIVDSKKYVINFDIKRTFWKYYLLGDLSEKKFSVVDLNNKVEFDHVGDSSLPGGRTALAFRSKTSIPLQERPDCHFQLRGQGSEGTNILIKRLAVPTANGINKEMIHDKEESVSEVYVNL